MLVNGIRRRECRKDALAEITNWLDFAECMVCGTDLGHEHLAPEGTTPRMKCPHCWQRYSIHPAGILDPYTNQPIEGIYMTDTTNTQTEQATVDNDALFQSDIAPLLQALVAKCGAANFPVLIAVALPPSKDEAQMMVSMNANKDGMIPNLFADAVTALGGTLTAASDEPGLPQ